MNATRQRRHAWVRPAVILLLGFLYAKLVCFGCWLAIGCPEAAVDTIAHWWPIAVFLTGFELVPFVILVGVDEVTRSIRSTAIRCAIRVGAWVGALVPLQYYFVIFPGILRGENNGAVVFVLIGLSVYTMGGAVIGIIFGGTVGLLIHENEPTK